MPDAENDEPVVGCPMCRERGSRCNRHDAESEELTERAEAALDAYFLGRIESEDQEPSSFGPRPIPPAASDQ